MQATPENARRTRCPEFELGTRAEAYAQTVGDSAPEIILTRAP